MAKNEKAVASVLAFEKKLVPSDGYFYGTSWDKRNEQTPLKLIQKSVRGTVSHRLKNKTDKDMLKLDMDITNANPQTVDACALGEHQDTLKVGFTLKVLGGIENPSACNNETFLNSYRSVAQNYIEKYGFTELAKRYALNIANARFLWRNRVGAEKVEVVVSVNDQPAVTFNALEYPLHTFDQVDEKVQALADQIAQALKGETAYLLIKVEAYALVGKAQEVYPSEELVLDKGKGDKSKILYHVNEVAAMHSQKVGNALRTIDTWYPEFEDKKTAIAIEPYGAVTNLGKAYRTPKDKKDFFTLFDKYALGEALENPEQEHYVMAVLVRGGVFGQSSKD
ncbi:MULTISPECIES: type I-F CRISPR-associated protein Csy3 [unclassified Acinetobacter]|uniref:type I-F CRISPR-associated protein Csy3 n=1 Tax=unclassified Acinetobacter TaxID=196816 RepID=UPI0024496A1B|nr:MULTISPECIES: type I-F CRISPR-associated protein Csy3 [unclassified Acinetobacter]MDH0030525.1 type I-F CRISPR-associated protein Csy3 [Acinetobacter sp. GD04021]MDH0885586.1 type I-F CRISPR-associated protein Csy3 [Acinetobacter sp. GD03873]MDH1082098.1 type I-F CRISPR-associated protein Csy3 [Acinetobacter sp. GD03983]MDH2188872.1 type I-F CRISPR-associated protein Csy3 [Acinetobacter sp. GD03645]MDH2202567.1 type I-F CRISPR-associated protein Csy3 [Acinetobacter sp. GD03647]